MLPHEDAVETSVRAAKKSLSEAAWQVFYGNNKELAIDNLSDVVGLCESMIKTLRETIDEEQAVRVLEDGFVVVHPNLRVNRSWPVDAEFSPGSHYAVKNGDHIMGVFDPVGDLRHEDVVKEEDR